MFGGEHQIGGPEQRVRSRREHLDIGITRCEHHRSADGSSDPVALHGLDFLRPVQGVEVIKKPIGIRCDPHHPLAQSLSKDREVAAFAAAVGRHLLIGQNGAQTRAPVDQGLGPVNQPMPVDEVGLLTRRQLRPLPAVVDRPCSAGKFGNQVTDRACLIRVRIKPGVVDLQEDPLGPPVEVDVRG